MGWGFALVHICFQYSLRKHQILSRLFYGTELATPLESMWDLTEVHVSNNLEKVKDFWAEAIKNLRTERDQVARRYNVTRRETPFKVGDIVVYRVKVLSLKGASHKPNPLSIPLGIVDLYSTLPWVTWEAVTVVEGIPWWGLLWHTGYWGSGLPKPRWKVLCRRLHGTGIETAVSLTIPLGEPGRTPQYVGLLSAWGSMDGDLMFFPICRRAPFWGLWQTHMNE